MFWKVLAVEVQVVHEQAALEGVAGQGDQVLGGPAVAAQQQLVDAQFPGLLGGQGDVVVVGGDEDDVRVGGLDLGERGAEVLLAGGVAHLGHHLAAGLLEAILEELGQAGGVRVVDGHEDRGLLLVQLLTGEVGSHLALVGVGEAGAEHEFVDLAVVLDGDLGVGGGGGDQGHLGLVDDGGHRDGLAGTLGAHDGDHLAFDQAESPAGT
ncbi:MAG: hypothetical protein ABSH53_19545 [Holophaga sp.]|jgi:hypothetical protein